MTRIMKTRNILFFVLAILLQIDILSAASPEIIRIRQRPDTIGLYEKFEVSLELKCEFVNPFDPADIDIQAEFTSPSGKKWKINGFYNLSMSTLWKVRFSPDETGKWSYSVTVRDKNGTVTSSPQSFLAVSSKHNGPLQVASNKRYLTHSNGKDFYGVGFWYNDGYEGFGSGRVEAAELDRLKSLGVNFISTFITPLETWATGVGRYDQNIAGRLDELLQMLEERDMMLSLNLWFHSYLSETVWGGGNVRWYVNPYKQITEAKDFYRSDEAWKYQEKLYRYFIARYGYSRSLALWFIIDEVNGTDGWVKGDSLKAAEWIGKVHNYLKANDPWNRPTTGTRSGGIKEFWHEGYQITDIAAREIYEAQGFPINRTSTIDSADVNPLIHSYRNYATENQKLWHGYGKPVINGETGYAHTFYEPSMPGYLAQYHNALWVTLATGSAMMPFWWAHSRFINDLTVNSQLTSLRRFTDRIPFAHLTDIKPANIKCVKGGDVYGMQTNELVFGWVVNSDGDVAHEKITVSSLKNGKYKLATYHTWRGMVIEQTEVTVTDGTITFGPPYMRITGSQARYIGQDMAFILEYIPEPMQLPVKARSGKGNTK
ncbi:MAG TPA: hypothetical protein DF818_18630 [Bacteroidales bacterium]|nr:hypothetical protein [Bacteroidales bacterium]